MHAAAEANATAAWLPLLLDEQAAANAAPLGLVAAVIAAFALSPVILICNALLLAGLRRFKRLRTPSNYLLCSLAASDMAVGLSLPAAVYVRITDCGPCLFVYCIIISLCSASILVMAAIAVDRFICLCQPLRYNELVTHTSMQKYLIVLWSYGLLIGFFPLLHQQATGKPSAHLCTFPALIDPGLQMTMLLALYGPCCAILVSCYVYIYLLAREHARAIYTVEVSLRADHMVVSRYGQTLAITVGCFVCLWMPFQCFMVVDLIQGSSLLSGWNSFYLSLPIFLNSALNPWIYGFRNTEIRSAVLKVVEEMLGRFGVPVVRVCPDTRTQGEQAELNSFASNMRLYQPSSPNRTTALLLTPAHHQVQQFEKSSLLTVPEIQIVVTKAENHEKPQIRLSHGDLLFNKENAKL